MMEENSKLQSLECHFNWNLDKPTNETLVERIKAIENHIKYNGKVTLVQSYCHQSYLESLKDYPDYDKILKSINNANAEVENLIKSIPKNHYFNNLTIGSGMKAVVLANKAICLSKRNNTGDNIKAESCCDEYKKLKEKYLGNLAEHPEVLLTKAFSLRASINIEKVTEAVKFYEQTLSNIDYWEQLRVIGLQDNYCDTLYSLVISKFKASQNRTLANKEMEDIEIILRQAILINPENHQAILKLAEILAKTLNDFVLEEVSHYIKKAEELDKEGKNIIILEGIATVYEEMRYGDQTENKKKAIEYYEKALELRSDSRRSLLGISTCNYHLYELKNTELQVLNDKKEEQKCYLTISRERLEEYKEKSELKLAEKLKLATIYMALEMFKDGDYLDKAESLYKEIVSKSEREGDQCRLLEAYAGYAELFDYKGDTDEKIQCLKEVVKNASNHKYDSTQVQKCVLDSQKKLLSYAHEKPDDEKFKLKGWVQNCRGHTLNAIFYYRQAIQKTEDMKLENLIAERLIDLLLKASDQEYKLYHGNFGKDLLDEGIDKIERINDKTTKSILMYKAMCIEAKKNMGGSDEIKLLLKLRHNFEKFFFEYIKDMAVTRVQNQEKKDAFSQTVLDVVSESKRLLDQGMDMIRQKVYGKELPYCCYPSPQKLDSVEKNCLEKRKREDKRNERERNKTSPTSNEEAVNKKSNKESADTEAKETLTIEEKQMKCLLEGRYKWKKFSDRFPGLFQYLVDKQPVKDDKVKKYKWLQDFISVRDEREHNHKHKEITQTLFTSTLSQRDLARNCSNYAAEVWKIIKAKIDSFEAMEICRKELEELLL